MQIVIDKDLVVTSRDGIRLSTDVYRQAEGGPYPVLVARLPYDKALAAQVLAGDGFNLMRAVSAGYAVVVQDIRGRFASEGSFAPFVSEAADGADTVQWAADQAWSTGAVGMIGGSYLGAAQWWAAAQAPQALRAIAPAVTCSQAYEGWAYQGGAFRLGFNLWWTSTILGSGELLRRLRGGDTAAAASLGTLMAAADRHETLFARRPLTGLQELSGLAPYYDDWLSHPDHDKFWTATVGSCSHASVTVPALNLGGWFDQFLPGTIADYKAMRTHGGSDQARTRQRLVIGPWSHGNLSGTFPERSFGVTAGIHGAVDSTGLQLQWFDELLKGESGALDPDRPVRIFVMGPDEWRDEADWPLPGTDYQQWYLHSDGRANTSSGDGSLTRQPPRLDEPEDAYLYDPRRPAPTTGGATFLPGLFVGANAGPRDQREVELRDDVLCYTTGALTEPLELTGEVHAVVHLSCSAPDTDVTAKLVDVHPDGRAMSVTDGILRARHRDSLTTTSLLQRGEIYALRVELGATATVFGVGHRLRLELSSSNFPRFDRNTNTGGAIASEVAADVRPALNRVHHSSAHASHLVLPVIQR